MKTLSFDKNKIKALIQLLDDPNNEVYDLVEKEILSGGSELIPYLQEGFDHSNNELQKTRLATLLDNFNFFNKAYVVRPAINALPVKNNQVVRFS